MRLELPWPPASLSPNARIHWARKSVIAKKYKNTCGWEAKTVKPFLKMKITFHPPSKHRRDIDNAIGSFKSGQDGIAASWGVDDSLFEIEYARKFGDVIKGGKVIVEAI